MKKTLTDYLYVLFGNGFSRGIALFSSIIIARMLGPAGFGVFSLFYVLMILTWQLPQAFDTTFVRYAKTSNCHREKRDFLKIAVFFKLLYSLVLLCISYPLSYLLANYCFHKPEIQNILVISMICGISLSFLMTVTSTFQEKEKFIEFASLNIFYTLSIFCTLLLFKILNFVLSLGNIILIYFVVSVVIGIASIVLLLRKGGNPFPLNMNALRTSFSLGKWIFGVTCVYFIFQRLDVLFLTRYVDFELVGIYSVATRLIMVVVLMTGSLSGVSLPKASKALETKNSLRKYIKESLSVIAMINIFIVGLMIIAPFCIKILYGNEYLLAASILRILLIGWFFAATYLPFSFLFYALDESKSRFLLELLKLGAGSALLSLLIPKYGLFGGAAAMSAVLVLNTFVSLIILRHKLMKRWKGPTTC